MRNLNKIRKSPDENGLKICQKTKIVHFFFKKEKKHVRLIFEKGAYKKLMERDRNVFLSAIQFTGITASNKHSIPTWCSKLPATVDFSDEARYFCAPVKFVKILRKTMHLK